ncbi:MAG: TIGR03790 family protein [Acidobacteriaceae bacterium]|nr:TIGR03790 family protein [Acidobacteriaceae bacterium]
MQATFTDCLYRFLLCAVFLMLAGPAIRAQAPSSLRDRVLVVYNSSAPGSKEVASYYIARRGIPQANLCKIAVSSTDGITQAEFDSRVKQPVRKCLDAVGKDKILYIVFSYNTPYVVWVAGPGYALDQFVADIWDEFLPERPATQSEMQPYFGRAQSQGNLYEPYKPFSEFRQQPGAKHVYSVWRLDAASPALAKGLVDKALFAEEHGLSGTVCIDRRTPSVEGTPDYSYGAGEWDLFRAAEFARKAGFTVIEDNHEQEFGTPPAPARCDHAAFYAGWYSLERYNDAFSWNPGAIGLHLDSASATSPRRGASWAANALQKGITVTAGAVEEPYLENLPHPDQALLYLLQGANVGDALFRSERMLKWRILNMGDPLYRPFPKGRDLQTVLAEPVVFALMPQFVSVDSNSFGLVALAQPPGPGGVRVSFKSSPAGLVTLPAAFTLPEKRNIGKFSLSTHAIGSDPAIVQLSLSAGDLHASNTLVVFSLIDHVAVTPSSGTVVLRKPAPDGGAVVKLASSNPKAVSVPAQVIIGRGESQAQFPVSVHEGGQDPQVNISATYEGTSKSAVLKVGQ